MFSVNIRDLPARNQIFPEDGMRLDNVNCLIVARTPPVYAAVVVSPFMTMQLCSIVAL